MIKYKKRINQVIDFNFGDAKIHPTDIDAILEFDNQYLIIFEVKKRGVDTPTGQRLLFERLADSWAVNGKRSWVIYCEHDTDPEEIVNLDNCFTRIVYTDNVYYKYKDHSVKDALAVIANKYDITKLKGSL